MSVVTGPRAHARSIAAIVAIAIMACEGSAQAQTAPVAPGALQVTARSESSLSLRWKDRSKSEAYYKVRVSGRVRRLAANRQAVTVTRLQPGVAYRVAVQACSRAGRCSKAATDTATTASARTAPVAPSAQPGPGTAPEPAPTSPPVQTLPPTPTAAVVVTGTVTVTTGNCMPTIGGRGNQINPCHTGPAAGARVVLYGPVLTHDDLLGGLNNSARSPTAQATTDVSGRYRLAVEPGAYSFLVDPGTGPECGLFDADWAACPHTLLAPAQTVDLNLDHAVW
jgi:hypothetical protein